MAKEPYHNSTAQVRDMEHDSDSPETRKVSLYGYDYSATTKRRVAVNADGSLVVDGQETTGFEGAPVTVGTTAVELTFTGTTQAIGIQADHDNTGNIWVGKGNITNTGGNAMARLMAGESLDIELNDDSEAVYVISDTASQTVYKLALT